MKKVSLVSSSDSAVSHRRRRRLQIEICCWLNSRTLPKGYDFWGFTVVLRYCETLQNSPLSFLWNRLRQISVRLIVRTSLAKRMCICGRERPSCTDAVHTRAFFGGSLCLLALRWFIESSCPTVILNIGERKFSSILRQAFSKDIFFFNFEVATYVIINRGIQCCGNIASKGYILRRSQMKAFIFINGICLTSRVERLF